MKHTNKNHAMFRDSWRRWAARDVVVTVHDLAGVTVHDLAGVTDPWPERIDIRYVDGCDNKFHGTSALTLAGVAVLAMSWIDWTLVMPDGSRTEHKGWLHPDHDHESTLERDATELEQRRKIRDAHPLSRELSWSCYETSCEYRARGFLCNPTEPGFPRPTTEEIANAPL